MKISTRHEHGGRARLVAAVAASTAALAVAACSPSSDGSDSPSPSEPTVDSPSAADDYPGNETLEWIIPFGPTAGVDAVTREIITGLEGIYPSNIVVRNIEGGSGSEAYSYLSGRAGNSYTISSAASNLYTTSLVSTTSWAAGDFTPVALVGTNDYYLVVAGDAPWDTLEEFAEAAQGERLTVGTVNVASASFIVQAALAQAAGYELDPVPFASNGELQTGLLSGSVDSMVASPSDVVAHVEAGTMKLLGFTGPEPMDFAPDVPSFSDLGYEVNVYSPYMIVLPPETDPAVQEWWFDAIGRVVESPEYLAYLESQYISPRFVVGPEVQQTSDDLAVVFEEQLRAVGAIE